MNGMKHIHVNDHGGLHAKVVVLGDPSTGKTSLVENLSNGRVLSTANNFFTDIDIEADEFNEPSEGLSSGVTLRIWEHKRNLSVQEEELAFRGALFTIVVLDIRKSESANAAFNKWIPLKNSLAAESFLFVVGTHMDDAGNRSVDLKDICKASAKKDAIYVEISNNTRANITMLRNLLVQRLKYILARKDFIASQRPLLNSSSVVVQNSDISKAFEFAEESKFSHQANNNSESSNLSEWYAAREQLSIPLLQQGNSGIMCDSVGAIAASCLGLELWPSGGFEEDGDQLSEIGSNLTALLDKLCEEVVDSNGIGSEFLKSSLGGGGEFAFMTESAGMQESNDSNILAGQMMVDSSFTANTEKAEIADDACVDADYDVNDVKDAFEQLGLPVPVSMINTHKSNSSGSTSQRRHPPPTLQLTHGKENFHGTGSPPLRGETGPAASGGNNNSDVSKIASGTHSNVTGGNLQSSRSYNNYLRKLTVKLPSRGSNGGTTSSSVSADMILDLESNVDQQVELFLLSNSIADNDVAKGKLLQIARAVQNEYRNDAKSKRG